MNDEHFPIHKSEYLDSVINILIAHRHFIGYININEHINTYMHINGNFHTKIFGRMKSEGGGGGERHSIHTVKFYTNKQEDYVFCTEWGHNVKNAHFQL